MDLQKVSRLGLFGPYCCIVPRVRFLFKNKKIVHFRIDCRHILSSKRHNFSQSRRQKGESVGWSETHIYFCLIRKPHICSLFAPNSHTVDISENRSSWDRCKHGSKSLSNLCKVISGHYLPEITLNINQCELGYTIFKLLSNWLIQTLGSHICSVCAPINRLNVKSWSKIKLVKLKSIRTFFMKSQWYCKFILSLPRFSS